MAVAGRHSCGVWRVDDRQKAGSLGTETAGRMIWSMKLTQAMAPGRELVGLAGDRLGHQPGTQATGAHVDGAHFTVGKLMPHALQVGVEPAVSFDVGVAHKVTMLGLFAAKFALLGHISSVNSGSCPKSRCKIKRVISKKSVNGFF